MARFRRGGGRLGQALYRPSRKIISTPKRVQVDFFGEISILPDSQSSAQSNGGRDRWLTGRECNKSRRFALNRSRSGTAGLASNAARGHGTACAQFSASQGWMFIHPGNEVTRATDRSFATRASSYCEGWEQTTFTLVDHRGGRLVFPTLRKKREGWGTRSFFAGQEILASISDAVQQLTSLGLVSPGSSGHTSPQVRPPWISPLPSGRIAGSGACASVGSCAGFCVPPGLEPGCKR